MRHRYFLAAEREISTAEDEIGAVEDQIFEVLENTRLRRGASSARGHGPVARPADRRPCRAGSGGTWAGCAVWYLGAGGAPLGSEDADVFLDLRPSSAGGRGRIRRVAGRRLLGRNHPFPTHRSIEVPSPTNTSESSTDFCSAFSPWPRIRIFPTLTRRLATKPPLLRPSIAT
jgi:hypothetical protein